MSLLVRNGNRNGRISSIWLDEDRKTHTHKYIGVINVMAGKADLYHTLTHSHSLYSTQSLTKKNTHTQLLHSETERSTIYFDVPHTHTKKAHHSKSFTEIQSNQSIMHSLQKTVQLPSAYRSYHSTPKCTHTRTCYTNNSNWYFSTEMLYNMFYFRSEDIESFTQRNVTVCTLARAAKFNRFDLFANQNVPFSLEIYVWQ